MAASPVVPVPLSTSTRDRAGATVGPSGAAGAAAGAASAGTAAGSSAVLSTAGSFATGGELLRHRAALDHRVEQAPRAGAVEQHVGLVRAGRHVAHLGDRQAARWTASPERSPSEPARARRSPSVVCSSTVSASAARLRKRVRVSGSATVPRHRRPQGGGQQPLGPLGDGGAGDVGSRVAGLQVAGGGVAGGGWAGWTRGGRWLEQIVQATELSADFSQDPERFPDEGGLARADSGLDR